MSASAPPPLADSLDHLFRHQAGEMVASLTRVFGLAHLGLAEDVVQEAFVSALRTWPFRGVPDDPRAWLLTVAKNRGLDVLRRQGSWIGKERELVRRLEGTAGAGEGESRFAGELADDQLRLIFACCHPRIPRDAQVALTLKTAGGFGVSEIARAFLTGKSTVAQRLVRAKRLLRSGAADLAIPGPQELGERRGAVLEVLYLMFNEGYSAHEGEDLVRRDLCFEALRIARLLAGHPLAGGPPVHAAAALFAFQAARLEARADAEGDLVLLAEQDRSLWDRRLIELGLRHLARAADGDDLTTYHLEAEIAGCHALAPSFEATDWRRIVDCYRLLLALHPSPVVALNHAVALGRTEGPAAALSQVEGLREDPSLGEYYPLHVTLGELYLQVGRAEDARRHHLLALELSSSQPVRRFLLRRLGR